MTNVGHKPTFDPTKLEIIRGAIRATQSEMDALLERTAIRALIRENCCADQPAASRS
jgi:N-methylhydantoinase B/oxoprolinase/acetone carboxylase alpha subunit